MANTIKAGLHSIEISAIDSDYEFTNEAYVSSIVLRPGAANDIVDLLDASVDTNQPSAYPIISATGDSVIFNVGRIVKLKLDFSTSVLSLNSKVIFNF